MIDSKQDEAVKLEAERYMADRFQWAAPGDQQEDAWLVRFCDRDCGDAIFTGPDAEKDAWECWNRYAPAFNIYVFRLATLPPANLNAPDKQEALAGEGVEAKKRDLRRTIEAALLAWADARPMGDKAGNIVRSWHQRLAVAICERVTQCSFCFLPATTEVDDESGPMAACDACAAAWAHDPGFVRDDNPYLSRTLPSNEALAGDDRNGVEDDVRYYARCVVQMYDAVGKVTKVDPSLRRDIERLSAALSRTPSSPQADEADVERVAFQGRVQPWMLACFGGVIAGDREERNHRFLEEALELVQACGCTAHEAHQLVDYVYGRPLGEPSQEVGGVMVTLAALCLANGLDMHAAGETELTRIWTKVEQIRAKQAAKPKHSPLPATMTTLNGVIHDAFAEDEPAALPKGEDLEQLILDARVAACGTRLTCREREAIRALCDAVDARAALPKEGEVEKLIEALREEGRQHSAASKMLADAKTARQTDRDDHPEMGAMRGYAYLRPEQTTAWKAADALLALSSLPVRSGEVGKAVRDVIEFAGDIRWQELAQGSPFTLIDRELLGEMHYKARSSGVLAALAPPPQAQAQEVDHG